MSEWEQTALGEVLMPIKRPVSVADLVEVPWAGARWYAEGIYARTIEAASKVKTKTLNRLELDDVAYNRMWATKAAFGVVGKDSAGCLVTGDFPIFVADRSRLLPEYMRVVFQSPAFQKEASLRAVGTTERRRLKERDFLAMAVALPAPAEQRRIVDVMIAVDAQMEVLEAERQTIKSLLAIMRDTYPEGTEHALSHVVAGIDGGKSVQTLDERPLPGEPAVLKLSAIQLGSFVASEAKRLADLTSYTDAHVVAEGDLLITRASGSFDRVGYATIARGVQPQTYMPDLIWRIRTRPDICQSTFLAHLLCSPSVRSTITSSARGTASMRKINKALLGRLRLPIPPLEEQSAYVERCDAVAFAAESLELELADLRAFRSALLTALLSREIEISESYDSQLEEVP